MEPVVKITVRNYVAAVMMDRPPVNARSGQLRNELIAAFDSFTDRDDVRVAILTGFGKMFPARRIFCTGWRVPAEEMYRLGIVECSIPLEQLMPEAMMLATGIASKSPLTMRYAKQSMNTTMHMPPRDGYRFGQNMTVALSKSDDAAEARAAFSEKRKPDFQGR